VVSVTEATLLVEMLQKPAPIDQTANPYTSSRIHTDGAVFIVYRQPIALDRFAVHDVRPSDTSGRPRMCTVADSSAYNFTLLKNLSEVHQSILRVSQTDTSYTRILKKLRNSRDSMPVALVSDKWLVIS